MARTHTLAVFAALAGSLGAQGAVIHADRKLLPTDGDEFHQFGTSVAIAHATVAVGAIGARGAATNTGAVYRFDALSGDLIDKLYPRDGRWDDEFGEGVALTATTLYVGAWRDAAPSSTPVHSGSLNRFDLATGAELGTTYPAPVFELGLFARTLAVLDEDLLVVGAPGDDGTSTSAGAAFLCDLATGAQLHKFLEPTPGANLGKAVAGADGLVVVGAPRNSQHGYRIGAAYVYDAATHERLARLEPDEPAENAEFGSGVAIGSGIVAVGAYLHDDPYYDCGAAYVFDAATGAQLAFLQPDDIWASDNFGDSVAIGDGLIAITSPLDEDPSDAGRGSVYLYDAESLAMVAKLRAGDSELQSAFGTSLALADGLLVVGAPFDNDNGIASGSAYIFELRGCNPADVAFPKRDLNVDDLNAFAEAFIAARSLADVNHDAVLNLDDIATFAHAFLAGCP